MVRPRRGLDRIGRDLEVAVGAVLEAYWRRQARRELAVHLGLGRSCADRTPADQVADVLWADHVEELAARRHTQPVDVDEQLACDAQPFVDAVAFVEVGIVDQAFPTDGGAGFFEIDPHHDLQRVRVLRSLGLELAGVVQCGGWVVDRARADHHQQPAVLAVEDAANAAPGVADEFFNRRAGNRKEADQVLGRWQRGDLLDALVVSLAGPLAQRIAVVGFAGFSVVVGLGRHDRFLLR